MFQCCLECKILCGIPLFGPPETASRSTVLSGLVTDHKQGIDIIGAVFPAILMQDTASLGKTHSGQAVILSDHKITLPDPVYQGKIHTVSALVKNKCFGSVPMKLMSCVAQKNTGDMEPLAQCYCDIGDRAAICIDENSHGNHLRHIIP